MKTHSGEIFPFFTFNFRSQDQVYIVYYLILFLYFINLLDINILKI